MTTLQKSRDGRDWDRLMALATKTLEPAIRRAFLQAAMRVKNDFTIAELTRLLESGQIAAAEQTAAFQGKLGGLQTSVQQALLSAAARELQGASEVLRTNISLDAFNPRVVQYAANHTGALIREISEDQRQLITEAVTNGLRDGRHPRDVAREIRELIGLTAQQRQHVRNYRRSLERGDLSVLARQLRDRRSDKKLERIFGAGNRLAAKEIDALVNRYAASYLGHRAETIARTEAMRALSAGHRLGWMQVLEQGTWGPNDLYTRWFVALDERVCQWCAPVPRMNEDGVPVDGEFDTPLGRVKGPPLHPRCRCVLFTRPR